MDIQSIMSEPLTLNKVYKVLTATHISSADKEQFIKVNQTEIEKMFAGKINTTAFQQIMKNRPLKLFKPIKNSFTKAGDKKILAKNLDIAPAELDDYIQEVTEDLENGNLQNMSNSRLEAIRTYVYRHGKKQELLAFLDNELANAGDILGVLYRTLQYNTGGAADYFVRPIHRMNNQTLVKMYDIVDKNLKNAARSGDISELDRERTAEWALVRIYAIQNNQKLRNAVKLKTELGM